MLSETGDQETSEHHANVIIQWFRGYLIQDDIVLKSDNALERIAMYHFAKLHLEVVEKAMSDFWKNIKIQTTYEDEDQLQD